MNRSLTAAAALLLLAGSACHTTAEVTCFSCPNWSFVSSEGCAEIAAQLNCEAHEVKPRDDGGCEEGLMCVLTGCEEEGAGGEVCSSFAQM